MIMKSKIRYTLPTIPPLLYHAAAAQPWVNDVAKSDDADDMSNLLFEARLRSGDYFITVATELDKLAALLQSQDIPEAAALLTFSAELTYLDKHYTLAPK
jgi:hypothetical protein